MILGEAIVQDEAIVQTAAGSWTKPSTIHGEGGPSDGQRGRETAAADARKRSMILGEAIVQTAAGSWTKPSMLHGGGGPSDGPRGKGSAAGRNAGWGAL